MKWFHVRNTKERFLTYLSEAEEYGGFSHCIKQTNAVRSCDGNIRCFDYNFTMDTVCHISSVLFDGRNLPKKQSNQNKKRSIAAFFTKDVIDRINEIYLDYTNHMSNLKRNGQLWKQE